jgi:hypothetical protein
MTTNDVLDEEILATGQRAVLRASAEFRGVGRLGQPAEGRVSFEERRRTNNWDHKPVMSAEELDYIGLVGELMFSGLRQVFARMPLNFRGERQQRTVNFSKFAKHGFLPRLYGWIRDRRGPLSDYDHPADWVHGVDVAAAVMKEMHILRKGSGLYSAARIRCIKFRDQHECDMIVRSVASAFLKLRHSLRLRRHLQSTASAVSVGRSAVRESNVATLRR